MAEFDERLWGAMVDYVTVGVDGGMTVVFRDGTRRLRNDINVNRFPTASTRHQVHNRRPC